MTRAIIIGLIVAAVGGGTWVAVNSIGHPEDGSGQIAFVMHLESTQCRNAETACFVGMIDNIGNREGSGTCWIEGFATGSEDHMRGPEVSVSLTPDEVKSVDLVWTLPPEENYAGGCTPAPVA